MRACTCVIRGGLAWLLALSLAGLAPWPAAASKVRVGIYQNSPKVFRDDEGIARGIFVEIIEAIAQSENLEICYVYGTWSENIRRLDNHEIDVMVDMSYSDKRAANYVLGSAPVLESWLDVYSTPQRRIHALHDLNGKNIAVLEGSMQEQYLREEIGQTLGIKFTLIPCPDYAATVQAIRSGRAELMVADRFFSFSPARDADIVPAYVVFRPGGLYFAFPRGVNPGLVQVFNRHVAAMKNNPRSVYYAALRRWLDIKPRTLIPPYIKVMLLAVSGLLAVIGLVAFVLRRQVSAQTRSLREAGRLLNETQAIARMGGWQYDVKTRRIKWTDEMYRIYGVDRNYDPNQFIRDTSFYAPQDAPVIQNAFQRAMDAGEPFSLELRLIRPNRENIWIRATSQPVKQAGKVLRVTGNIMDITASKIAELDKQKLRERLIVAQKMEAVGRLTGGVAHDFNNMLGVILGYAEQALARVEPGTELQADLKEIYDAALRSTNITKQLLAFSRKQSFAPEVLDLNAAIEGSLKLLRRLIGENIELIWRPGKNLWPVLMDPVHVDQILANLCVNARDAIADIGRVVIETGTLVCDDAYCAAHENFTPGEYSWIRVSDSGCGMSPETLAQIFEPFFTTKKLGKGTGLGLATINDIVKHYHGLIEIDSHVGRGTAVTIFQPRPAARETIPAAGMAAPGGRAAGETILLVEDEQLVLKLISNMLAGMGYKVLIASSPDAAIAQAGEYTGEIHLLLTDVVMPGLNGRELAARLNQTRPGMKCLYMSGYSLNLLLLDEGDPFIQKPFLLKDLSAKIQAVLG